MEGGIESREEKEGMEVSSEEFTEDKLVKRGLKPETARRMIQLANLLSASIRQVDDEFLKIVKDLRTELSSEGLAMDAKRTYYLKDKKKPPIIIYGPHYEIPGPVTPRGPQRSSLTDPSTIKLVKESFIIKKQ